MKNNILSYLGIFFFSILFATQGFSQKKVLGKPANYERPVDYFDNPANYKNYLTKTSPKSKSNAWLVYSDRDNNSIYDKPNGTATPQTMAFRESFFVVSEKDEWIKIIKARVDGLKIVKGSKVNYGWVRKDKMLMWNSSVSHKVTRIHKKILLLNRADQIQRILQKPEKELVKIYSNPSKTKKETTKKIFEYFFMLKKEKNMYLISNEANLNAFSPERIIGWVDARDCDIWDTRICLAPNFEPEAVKERTKNKNLIMRAYDTAENARNSASGGSKETGVFWKSDPVMLSKDEKNKSNPNRFLGSVIRFPMVSVSGDNDSEIYKSGIVGKVKLKSSGGKLVREVDENRLAKLEKRLKSLESKASKINIFYVIEGTDHTFPFKEAIIKSVKEISNDLSKENLQKVNYGALIYRDIPEEEVMVSGEMVDRLTEHTPLHPDIDRLTNFLEKSEFKNKVDRDEYSAMFYGMNRAMLKAGFKSHKDEQSELNIIILIGAYGDLRMDKDRRKAAAGHHALFNSEKLENLVDNLYSIDAHLYTVQLANDGYKASTGFAKGGQYLMVENAKMLYNKQQQRMNNKIKEGLESAGYKSSKSGPSLELDESNKVSHLMEGVIPGQVSRPLSNNLSDSEITSYLRDNIKNSISHVTSLKNAFVELISKGGSGKLSDLTKQADIEKDERAAGSFEQALIDELVRAMEDNPDLEIPDMTDEKYKLFTEAYIPYKYPEATYPLVSFVLFMPESDLVEYVYNIERNFATFASESSYDKKREGLVKIYKALLNQFTGEGSKTGKNEDDVTIADIQRMINGVYNAGLKLNEGKDIPIKDILNERKVSAEKVDELIQRFKTIKVKLEGVLREGESYDFCMKTSEDNRYYWIPIEDTF